MKHMGCFRVRPRHKITDCSTATIKSQGGIAHTRIAALPVRSAASRVTQKQELFLLGTMGPNRRGGALPGRQWLPPGITNPHERPATSVRKSSVDLIPADGIIFGRGRSLLPGLKQIIDTALEPMESRQNKPL